MSSTSSSTVQLGFADDQDSWLLTNRFFPSKVGGKPAWLELKNIPETKDLLCEYCNEPCIFLCQVYAASAHIPHAFHRTIFVFICKNGKCCSLNQNGNIKVLRSQLRLQNEFYPDTPADESVECDEIESPVKTCRVCSCRGPLVCGKCKQVSYCGQLHQKLDWKTHKQQCGVANCLKSPVSEVLFPEFEIIIEEEEKDVKMSKESEKEAEKRRLKEFEEMVKSGQAGAMADMSDADLNDFAESKEDKLFGKFKKAIDGYETQILRYSRHGSPLWISDRGILNPSFIPNCNSCKGKRTFEFQIMPQMLNEMKNYELDWGVIAVYTCEKDCDVNGEYVQEFCYKQDIMKGEDDDGDIDMEKLKMLNVNNQDGVGSRQEDGGKLQESSRNHQEASRHHQEASTNVPSVKHQEFPPQPNKKSSANDKKKQPVKKPEKKAFAENDDW